MYNAFAVLPPSQEVKYIANIDATAIELCLYFEYWLSIVYRSIYVAIVDDFWIDFSKKGDFETRHTAPLSLYIYAVYANSVSKSF